MEDEMTAAAMTTTEYYAPADRLEEVARRCQAGEPLPPDHSNWLGASMPLSERQVRNIVGG
jgi:hypothetical protein